MNGRVQVENSCCSGEKVVVEGCDGECDDRHAALSVTLLTNAFGAQAHTCHLDNYTFHCDAHPLRQQRHNRF
jgi:hypothetical protein